MHISEIITLFYQTEKHSHALANLRENRKSLKNEGRLNEETDNKIGYFMIKNRYQIFKANQALVNLAEEEVCNIELYDFLHRQGITGIVETP